MFERWGGVKVVSQGMRFADRTKLNEVGSSIRTLTVLLVRQGGTEGYKTHHFQLVYVECGIQWADGRVGKCWIALHRLPTSDYKLLPEGVKFECERDRATA